MTCAHVNRNPHLETIGIYLNNPISVSTALSLTSAGRLHGEQTVDYIHRVIQPTLLPYLLNSCKVLLSVQSSKQSGHGYPIIDAVLFGDDASL